MVTDDGRRLFVGGPWHGEMHLVGDGHPVVVEDIGPSDWMMLDAPLRARPRRTVYYPFRVWLEVAGVRRLREVWSERQPSDSVVKDAVWMWWWSAAPPVPAEGGER